MNRWLLLGAVAVAVAACGNRKPADPSPAGSGAAPALPDALDLDWKALRYDLGSLGVVVATGGRAEFRVTEDDTGIHASQTSIDGAPGFLALSPPSLVDLDGDHHDETVIPFELHSVHDSLAGAFVFTLRDGLPLQLGTITTTKPGGFTVVGTTIKTDDGAIWTWDPKLRQIVRAP